MDCYYYARADLSRAFEGENKMLSQPCRADFQPFFFAGYLAMFSFRFFGTCHRRVHVAIPSRHKAEPEAVRQIASSPRWTDTKTELDTCACCCPVLPSRVVGASGFGRRRGRLRRRAGGIGKQPWTTVTDARRSMSMISLLLSSARTCKIILAIGPVPSVRSCYS